MLGKRSLLLIVLVSLCQLVVSEKLELNAKKLSANVTVPSEQLNLKVETGGLRDYSPGKQYKFSLLIGGCNVDIVAASSGSKIDFEFKVNEKRVTVKNLNSIAATKGDLTLSGFDAFDSYLVSGPLDCDVKFEKEDEKIVIAVTLSGDVPPNFKLRSEAEIYIPEKKDSEANLMLLVYIGVPVVCVAIFISIGATVGFFIWRRQKNARALSEEKANTRRLEVAKAVEDQLAAEKLVNEKLLAEKISAEKEKLASKSVEDQLAAEKLANEKVSAEKKELASKSVEDQLAAEKLANEKLISDEIAAEKEKLDEEKAKNEKKSKVGSGNGASTNVQKNGDEKQSKAKEDGSGKIKQSRTKKSQDGKPKVRPTQKTTDYTKNEFTVGTIDVLPPSDKSYE